MSFRGIAAVVVGVFAWVMPGHAVDTAVPGRSGTFGIRPQAGLQFAASSDIIAAPDAGAEQPAEPAPAEDAAPAEPDWLASPPDPARHNLWVPSLEWATALSLTIPLFMIDPSAFNVAPISADRFADAWTEPPDWDDGDGIVANYILHPIMGAEAYLTVRNRDYGPIESFLFSSGVSFAWEYLIEAWVQQPSAIDLVTTSPIGSVQGEIRYQLRRRIAQWRRSLGRDALLVLIDPVEALHRYIGKQFLNQTPDAPSETMGSALNFGPDQANLMITLRY